MIADQYSSRAVSQTPFFNRLRYVFIMNRIISIVHIFGESGKGWHSKSRPQYAGDGTIPDAKLYKFNIPERPRTRIGIISITKVRTANVPRVISDNKPKSTDAKRRSWSDCQGRRENVPVGRRKAVPLRVVPDGPGRGGPPALATVRHWHPRGANRRLTGPTRPRRRRPAGCPGGGSSRRSFPGCARGG